MSYRGRCVGGPDDGQMKEMDAPYVHVTIWPELDKGVTMNGAVSASVTVTTGTYAFHDRTSTWQWKG